MFCSPGGSTHLQLCTPSYCTFARESTRRITGSATCCNVAVLEFACGFLDRDLFAVWVLPGEDHEEFDLWLVFPSVEVESPFIDAA